MSLTWSQRSETEVEVVANVDVEDGAEDLEHTTIDQ